MEKVIIVATAILFILVILPNFFQCPACECPPTEGDVEKAAAIKKAAVIDKVKAEKEAAAQRLSSYYKTVSTCIPEDYPRRDIGACPYAKAQSSDLPLANVPMCVAVGEQNMRLVPLAVSV